ncbi:MAG: hypothetical protein E7384_03660 [Ruminococcaceae bacterium]|nr:hypothetical protein [Oscillospiraceae bacterium]
MFCSNCGNNCTDGSAFCTNCGANLNTQPTQPANEQPVSQVDQPVFQQTEQPVYQQPTYQQPVYQQVYEQAAEPQEETNSKAPGFGLSIPGMILGILSTVFCCVFYVAPFFGIPGLILSIISLVKGRAVKKTNGMAVVGLICSIVGILFSIGILVLFLLGITESAGYPNGGYYGYY